MVFLEFRPYFRPSKKEKPPKRLIISSFRGFFEVPGGFEPPYTVLQTAD